MRGWTFRALLLVVATAFAVLVVGGIAIATYVIYFNSLSNVTKQRAGRTAQIALAQVLSDSREASLQAKERGLEGSAAVAAARSDFLASLANIKPLATYGEAHLALYADGTQLLWASDSPPSPSSPAARVAALKLGRTTVSQGLPPQLFSGLLRPTHLANVTNHVPLALPDGSGAVLDVSYVPTAEDRVIDSLRTPMTLLTLTAGLLMVVIIESSILYVLRLVGELREAADSIDAGRLDARLPDLGANEVGDLARSVNRLIDRLQRRAASQTQFVANASHELATPVAGIRGYVDILRRWGIEDPQVRDEAIEAIDRESQRMSRLTSDLLNVLQSEGGVVFRSERFDVNALVRERLAATASAWLEKDIEFEGPDEGELNIWGDRGRLEDVLSILLENAAKYTSEHGNVAVRTDRKREFVLIDVSDTGPGISDTDLPHIFDRFYRSSASRAAGEPGFGLGLSIAKDVVDLAGGEMQVTSVLGEGTNFRVCWPRGRPPRPS